MTGHVRLFVTVVMLLASCSLPSPKAKQNEADGAASDARSSPARVDAASPARVDAATPAPPDAASPALPDAARPALPDAASPALPDAASPALPDTGVRSEGGAVVPVAISAGLYSTCALLADGSVKCWGYNAYGQLGNGTRTNSTTPVPVQGLNHAIALSASDGYHACAVLADRTVVCWGSDYLGALGDGSQVDSAAIKTVSNLSNAISVSTGGNGSCATLLDQTARCWGSLPDGSMSSTPVPIVLSGVASIQIGTGVVCALLADGTVRCWGDNTSGQIGNGTYGEPLHPVTTPTEVKGVGQVVALSAGYSSACAVLADHTAVCWGSNTHGQLGNGTVSTGSPSGSATPVPVSGLTNVVAIGASSGYACALLADGTVRCWGDNEDGTLGNGTAADSSTPVQVSGLTDIVAITTGTEHACALAVDGTIWCWGLNSQNELGHDDTHDSCQGSPCSRTPVRVEWTTNPDGGPDSPPPPDAASDLPLSSDAGQPCRLSSDCAGQGGTFCQKDSCDPSAVGVCTLIPGTRSTGYCQGGNDLVCGCDGTTYSYPCLAHAQAVNIASHGACPLPDSGAACASNSDCGSSFYCKKATCAAATGVCTADTEFLVCYNQLQSSDGGQAVCGCDHVTYSNDCEAASYGINVEFAGQCPPPPSGPCTSQADCGGDSYSALVFCMPTVCGDAASGRCTSLPGACPGIVRPVCGCNGRLYSNSCYAEQARVGWYVSDGGCP